MDPHILGLQHHVKQAASTHVCLEKRKIVWLEQVLSHRKHRKLRENDGIHSGLTRVPPTIKWLLVYVQQFCHIPISDSQFVFQ